MLKYLVVLLSDKSVSYCSYDSDSGLEDNLISVPDLHNAIIFGMKENLMIQFVYPEASLTAEHIEEINSIDHTNIMPYHISQKDDIGVINDWSEVSNVSECETVIVRTTLTEITANADAIKKLLKNHQRVNISFKNFDGITESEVSDYRNWLISFALNEFKDLIRESEYIPQLNVLYDRLSLKAMNNCNAGAQVITVAPDGKFYICPGFYYDKYESAGNPKDGLKFPNPELFSINRAPICRICDVWHCKRCVWSNIHRTNEINIPGRIQCLIAHAEREASRILLNSLHCERLVIPEVVIDEIDYNDPFVKLMR